MQATPKDVGARLRALDELVNKGVHADVTTHELYKCVVQTHLVVADTLRIHERSASPADYRVGLLETGGFRKHLHRQMR